MSTIAKGLCSVALSIGLALLPTVQAQDSVQAGVSAAVRGDVQVSRANVVGQQINSGESIFLQDATTSGTNSGMQILLLDETVFTIGPDSEMLIDEFVYDPASGEGSLVADLAKGTMRFVTGNIAAGTPENMTIKLPVGTIGIRGTIGIAAVLTPQIAAQQFPNQAAQLGGGGNQPVVFGALTGPGPLSNVGGNVGSFNFSSPDGSVDVNRPGGAFLAAPGQPPLFFIAPPGAIQQVTAGLSQRTGGEISDDSGSTDDGTNTGDNSGDDSGSNTGEGSGDNTGDNSGNNTGTITGSFQTQINFSSRSVDIQTFGSLSQSGVESIGSIILNGGSGVVISLTSTGFEINSGNNTGSCSTCTGSVSFPNVNTLQLDVSNTYMGNTGSGTGTATLTGGS